MSASSGKRSNESVTAGSLGKKTSAQKNSDSASAKATNQNGFSFFDSNYRSVLYHPVGLPLVAVFHGADLPAIPSYPVQAFPPEIRADEKGNSILSEAWSEKVSKDMKEPGLTDELHSKINSAFSDQFRVEKEARLHQDGTSYEGRLDLAFLPNPKEGKSTDTPLCVVEVGLSSNDWWKKFDQGKEYLEIMQRHPKAPYCFEEPLLLAIITLDGSIGDDFVFQMGVLLCTPRNNNGFRISLIWHKQYSTMEEATKSFGFLLRILPHFQTTRSQGYDGESEYFSSNCIRTGETVLRSYDARFRPSDRRPDLYRDPVCANAIFGQIADIVLEISVAVATDQADYQADSQSEPDYGRDGFWTPSPKKQLLVIATPFRKGLHFAKYPTDFLPIIAHLQKLHKAGYVHGDIRAYNTVFSEQKGGPGFLIDFDFSGKKGEAFYPMGYNPLLPDGYRRGEGGKEIKVWEDWSAVGKLTFQVHQFDPPLGGIGNDIDLWLKFTANQKYWSNINDDVPPNKIAELKNLLEELDEKNWVVKPGDIFNDYLEKSKTSGLRTKQGATGSPPKGTHP